MSHTDHARSVGQGSWVPAVCRWMALTGSPRPSPWFRVGVEGRGLARSSGFGTHTVFCTPQALPSCPPSAPQPCAQGHCPRSPARKEAQLLASRFCPFLKLKADL